MDIRVLKSGGKKEKPSGKHHKSLKIIPKRFKCLFRIAEVEGSIPFESTKNGNRRGKNHGDFSFDHRNTTDGF